MAKVTIVSTVTRQSVRLATNTPGGCVRDFVDDLVEEARNYAVAASPKNKVANAMHRGGVVGTYKASWRTDRRGSNGSNVQGRLSNDADHAIIVEEGRSAAFKWQKFSWTKWGGGIQSVRSTKARRGRHIAAKAIEKASRRWV